MRRSTAVLTPLVVLVVLAVLLAACSSDNSSTDTAGSDTEASASSTATSTRSEQNAAPVDQTPPPGVNGIKIDDEGNLWVASIAANQLIEIDPTSGEMLQRIDLPTGTGPDDLVIADDGTIYWTGFQSGAIGSADPATGTTAELANIGAGANPIAQREDGVLVAGRAINATGLFAVDPEGGEPETLADPGNVNSFSISPDGVLYGPLSSPDGGAAIAIDPDTGETIEKVADIPGIPTALRWSNGQLFVLTVNDGAKIYQVDLDTREATLYADVGIDFGDNLAVADSGAIYVTQFSAPQIIEIGPDGTVVQTIAIGG